ncbi:MAG: hypothetical protein J7599_12435 [Niabella sp.]|nr:hypothetical protein [Niabella sp.]
MALLLSTKVSNAQTNVFPASGNVGVGTTTPQALVHIAGANQSNVPVAPLILSRYWGDNTNTRASALFHYMDGTNDKLVIAVSGPAASESSPASPVDLLRAKMVIQSNGYIGIGTVNPTERLAVNGTIRARELKIQNTNWPDYVFRPSYRLMSLSQIERFITTNGHLPEVPSAKEVAEKGIEVGANQAILLKKIEELTLHLIQLEKKVTDLEKEKEDIKYQLNKKQK